MQLKYVNVSLSGSGLRNQTLASLFFVVAYVSIGKSIHSCVGFSTHDSVGVVRPCLGLQHFGQPLASGVGVVVEVEKEEQENHAVGTDDVDKDGELVWAVIQEEILADVGGDHDKLDQLNGGEVLLPPQVFLVFWAHSTKSVVCVHNDVNNTVEESMECSQTTWSKADSKPPSEWHD